MLTSLTESSTRLFNTLVTICILHSSRRWELFHQPSSPKSLRAVGNGKEVPYPKKQVTLYQEVLEVSNPEDEDMVFRNVGECQ